jgi:hypothetical protein
MLIVDLMWIRFILEFLAFVACLFALRFYSAERYVIPYFRKRIERQQEMITTNASYIATLERLTTAQEAELLLLRRNIIPLNSYFKRPDRS